MARPASMPRRSSLRTTRHTPGWRTGITDAIRLSRRHELAPTARVEHHRFGPALRLVGYDLPGEGFQAGTSLPLTLYWQASAKLGQDYEPGPMTSPGEEDLARVIASFDAHGLSATVGG